MGRPPAVPFHLVPMVVELWDKDATVADIQQHLAAAGSTASVRTIRTIVRNAGGKARATSYAALVHDINLRSRISDLFYTQGLPDDLILEKLEREGYSIKPRTFVQLRRDMGIKKRLREEEFQQARDTYKEQVREELDRGGISSYGTGFLQTHFRTMDRTRLYLGKNRLYELAREIYPAGPYNRAAKLSQRRGKMITPGPDFMWSMDAHCKLEEYGFQIYAAIDADTRYILYHYLGPSARTMVSVLSGFAKAGLKYKRVPRLIRTDKGKETLLLAQAHYEHAKRVRGHKVRFRKCFIFGSSTRNIRIESWWGVLTKGRMKQWHVYFKNLRKEGWYNKARKADRVAMKYVYTRIMRRELAEFVQVWNKHKVRKQLNRPHVIPGVPNERYNYPKDRPSVGYPIDEQYFLDLEAATAAWDPEEYLPTATKERCSDILQSIGFKSGRPSSYRFVLDSAKPEHRIAYENLVEQLRKVPESEYTETAIPKGGRKWEGFRVNSDTLVRAFRDQCDDEYDREKLDASLSEVIAPELQIESDASSDGDSDVSESEYWTDDE